MKLASELAFGKPPFCLKIDVGGNFLKYSCSVKNQFVCEKEPKIVTGKKQIQLTHNSTNNPSSPLQLWYRYRAASQRLLNSWKEKRTTGFQVRWSIRDQNGVQVPLETKPSFINEKLKAMVRLARQGRLENKTRDQMVLKASKEKKYWTKKRTNGWKGIDINKCSGGQIDLDKDDQIFSKITLGLKDESDDGGEVTEEDIANGFAIYAVVVFCSKESEQMQAFLSRVVSDETGGTILKAIVNTLHSWKISLDMKRHLGKFYLSLDKRLNLNVGKILLAASTSSQLSAMMEQDLPYLEPFKEETEECIKGAAGDCQRVTDLVKNLGNVHCYLLVT